MKKILPVLFVSLFALQFVAAQTAPNYFKPTLKRIAIFKNGYVFTYREGEAQPVNGVAYTTEVPTGVMGTVWGYATAPQVRVAQLTAGESEKKETQRVTSFEELMLVNEGLRVKVKGHDRYYEGELITLTPRRPKTPANNAEVAPNLSNAGNYDIALKTAEGVFVIEANHFSQLEILGPAKFEKTVTSKENRLTFKTEGAGGKAGLGVAALERGIRWIPAYRIQLQGEPVREARLELEAMVINELADLDNTEVHFIVGVPHFLYKDIISPLSLTSTFAGVSSYFQTNANVYSNAIMTQSRAGELRRREDVDTGNSAVASGPEDQLPAASADELFLYRAEQLSLKKGERASLRLFSLNVPCTEVYEWDVPDSTDAGYDESRPVQNLANGVWFGVKMKNQTQMPWTTAPAISFRDWKALGQDMLSFTPVGSDVFVRVSPAIEVIGRHQLEEKSRTRQVVREGNGVVEYDVVTLEGVVKVKNNKKQPVNIVLKRHVNGAVSAVSDNGVAKRQGAALEALNPQTNIRWELTIPPGEKELRYTYKTYIRR